MSVAVFERITYLFQTHKIDMWAIFEKSKIRGIKGFLESLELFKGNFLVK